MDIDNKDYQVELNNERLKEEYERYNEIRSRIGYISIIYTAFAIYTIPLIESAVNNSFPVIYCTFLSIFLILFILSMLYAILLLLPKEIAFKDVPKYFYKDIKQKYLDNGIPDNEVKYYVTETYLIQIEKAVEANFKLNNKKSKYHYLAFKLAIYAIVPYFISVGFKAFDNKSEPIQVEIVNKCNKSNINLNDATMSNKDQNDQGQQTTIPPEPKIDPSKVIVVEPVQIKEGKEVPNTIETK